jgi:hypothetical protein
MLKLLAYSVEVEHIFFLGVMVKLGVILLVKLNGAKKWLPAPKNDYRRICALCKKVGEIDPWYDDEFCHSFFGVGVKMNDLIA